MINPDDERKIGNTLAHIVDSGLEKGRTKLVKVPVFADLVSYNLFGEFVTCDTYIKQDHGPMGDIAGELTRKSNKYLIVGDKGEEEDRRRPFAVNDDFTIDISFYSETQKILIDASYRWISPQKTTEVSNITHEFNLWKNYSLLSPIPKEAFRLNKEEIEYIGTKGIIISDFGKDCCSVSKNLPIYYESLDKNDLDQTFRDLSKKFPDDLWDEHLDCFLAALDAMRECARTENPAECLPYVCDYVGAMNAALAYTPNLNKWVTSILDEYTDIFDDAISDAIGFGEHLPPVSEDIKETLAEIMVQVKDDAIKRLNGE